MGTNGQKPPINQRGSIPASVLGIIIFLAGIGLLVFTFQVAHTMFQAPVEQSLGVDGKPVLDLAQASQSLIGVLAKILILIVMGLLGSLIANRGISLFAGSRLPAEPRRAASKRESPADQDANPQIGKQSEVSPK